MAVRKWPQWLTEISHESKRKDHHLYTMSNDLLEVIENRAIQQKWKWQKWETYNPDQPRMPNGEWGDGDNDSDIAAQDAREKRLAALEDKMSAKYPHCEFDFHQADPATMEKMCDHVDKLFQDYPDVAKSVPYVGTGANAPEGFEPDWDGGGSLAQTIQNEWEPEAYTPILLNPEYFGFPEDAQDVLDSAKEDNWFTDYSLEGTITHEFGHVINFYLEKAGKGKFVDGEEVSSKVSQFMKDNKALGDDVSEYARSGGPIEAFAEGFTSMYHNSEADQAPYTKNLKSFLDQTLPSGSNAGWVNSK